MSYINKNLNVNSVNLSTYPYDRELFMEAFLIENKNLLKLEGISDDVEIIGYEVPIIYDKCEQNGRADILALYPSFDKEGNPKKIAAIIELKKDKITKDHIEKQLRQYLEHKNDVQFNDDILLKKWKDATEYRTIGIMVGQDIDLQLASEIVNSKDKDSFRDIGAITLKRFKGNDGNIYIITDTYFPDEIKPSSQLRITYNDGQEDYGAPTDVYVKAIQKIGIDRIVDLQEKLPLKSNPLIFDNKKHKLISDHKYDDTTGHRPIEDGKWWIFTHFSTKDKIKKLEYLRDQFKDCLTSIKNIKKE